MKRKLVIYILAALMIGLLAMGLSSCGSSSAKTEAADQDNIKEGDDESETAQDAENTEGGEAAEKEESTEAAGEASNGASGEAKEYEYTGAVPEGFTERDFDIGYSDYETVNLSSLKEDTYSITQAGNYLLSGDYEGQIVVDVPGKEDKVQIILDNANITNDSSAAIYVLSADKVFFTTTAGSVNRISTTGTFVQTDENEVDGAIFSKDDIVFNGEGTLVISCDQGHGIVSKDNLKITSGTYEITVGAKGLSANDLLAVAGGDISIISGDDGINSDLYATLIDGNITIEAQGDGVHADAIVTVDGGALDINASEGLEGTVVRVNDGDVNIYAWDDGVNASQKVTDYDPTIEINGGNLAIEMAGGDTDALDSNGYIYINGGTVNIKAQFAFDYEWDGVITGGEVYVNGEQVTEIYNSMMGGGGHWGSQGGPQGGMHGGMPGGSQGSSQWGQGGPQGGMPGGMPGGSQGSSQWDPGSGESGFPWDFQGGSKPDATSGATQNGGEGDSQSEESSENDSMV